MRLAMFYRLDKMHWLGLVFCLSACFTTLSAHALSASGRAAVHTILSDFLLGGDDVILELTLNDVMDGVQVVNSDTALLATFGNQGEDVELCFHLTPNGPLQPGDLTFRINGVDHAVVPGENCFSIPLGSQGASNTVLWQVQSTSESAVIRFVGLTPVNSVVYGLPVLTRGGWDGRAVRKVLKIFAFGGHALDAQIETWASMAPGDAIAEMLTFDQHNTKLSPILPGDPYTETASAHGTMTEFLEFISSSSSNIPIPRDRREQYGLDGYNFDDGYNRMITVRGLNPFRQRIGFWETNYHLAVNRDAAVSRRQMARYYDEIMAAHESGVPYHEVMGVAAKTAAVAMQYGHRNNRWNASTGECECNEDFAREIHQLYYGIFGAGDPNHEDITIPETARLLTDMRVPYIQDFGFATEVSFGTQYHFPGAANIFGQPVAGVDASAKIDALMPMSIQHPESLQNLPVMIISVLADDNLDDARKDQLRAAWAALGPDKDFLEFIRTYAISEMFHGPEQFKYLTSHERALYMANKNNLMNIEAYFGGGYHNGGRAGRTVGGVISDDLAGEFFRPLHNVFGGQTSAEASDSALAFEKNYNRLTDREEDMRRSVVCDECDRGRFWEKPWQDVLPRRADGKYYIADVAAWLWNHAVGNLDNYTQLERAHLYSLLGAARINPGSTNDGDHAFDFNLLMCVIADYQVRTSTPDEEIPGQVVPILTGGTWDDYCRGDSDGSDPPQYTYEAHELAELYAAYTGQQIAGSTLIQGVLDTLGDMTLPLNAPQGSSLRKHARERVNSALGFIFTTPFVFAEGG